MGQHIQEVVVERQMVFEDIVEMKYLYVMACQYIQKIVASGEKMLEDVVDLTLHMMA